MALNRKYQKIFGKNAATEDIGVVGSKNEGTAQNSKDVETIQSLYNWETGLRAQVNSSDAPYLQDQNAIFYVITSQLAYLFQSGIAEWNSQTEYIANRSVVLRSGKVYVALANSTNVEPEVTSGWTSYWKSLDVSWGGILGNLKNQTDLFNILLKGIFYDNTFTCSKKDRVLYQDEKGYKYFVESLVDSNTSAPSSGNVWYAKDIKYIEQNVSPTNPLPTASEENLGKIWGNSNDNDKYYICELVNGNYVWNTKTTLQVFNPNDTVFYKPSKLYDAVYTIEEGGSIVFARVLPLGTSYLSEYKWICTEPFHNSFPSDIYVVLTLGASNSEYVAPADGWFNIRVKTTNTGQYLLVTCKDDNDNEIYNMEINSGYTGNNLALLAPVSKGQKIKVSYNSSSSEKSLKFIYAQKGE